MQLAGSETELALQFVRCMVVLDEEPEVKTLPVMSSEDTILDHVLNSLLFHAVSAAAPTHLDSGTTACSTKWHGICAFVASLPPIHAPHIVVVFVWLRGFVF